MNVFIAVASGILAITEAVIACSGEVEDWGEAQKELNTFLEATKNIQNGTTSSKDYETQLQHWRTLRDEAKIYYEQLKVSKTWDYSHKEYDATSGLMMSVPVQVSVDAETLKQAENQFKGFSTLVEDAKDKLSVQRYIDEAMTLASGGTASMEEYGAAMKNLTDIQNNVRTASKGLVDELNQAFGVTEETSVATDELSKGFTLTETQAKSLQVAIDKLRTAEKNAYGFNSGCS